MKVGYFRNYNGILDSIMPFYNKTTNLLKADFYLGWQDVVQPDKRIIELCKEYKIPSLIVEHGMKAVSDYQKDLKDTSNGMGGKELIADKILVWGNKSKQIMLEAGVKENRIEIVGSPIIWKYEYKYKNGDQEKIVEFMAGKYITDPVTKLKWELTAIREYIPSVIKKDYVFLFIYHDWTPQGIQRNKEIYDQLKHRDDLFVIMTTNYGNEKPENPFLEIVKMPNETRSKKAIINRTSSSQTMIRNRALLQYAKCVVAVAPGTINGVAWSYDIPTIVPRYDWGWKVKGKTVYDIHKADYECDPLKINEKIEEVWENDTKVEDRKMLAKDFMGTEMGVPRDNIRAILD